MAKLPLLRREITLDEALGDDDNILARLDYPSKQSDFWTYLHNCKPEIEAVVSFHLGVTSCQVADEGTWLFGSYNVCIPVEIKTPMEHRVLVRVPLPFKLGEAENPGNVEEKLRSEVAAYIWIQENCPDVPIPTLFGFGFPDGQSFTNPLHAPLLSRIYCHATRRLRYWLGLPVPCSYVGPRFFRALTTGYMIISVVTDGRMLSDSWMNLRGDETRRKNLFCDFTRIVLSLSRIRLPRIGSLTLNNDGLITLTNRPLTLRLQTFENEGIPTIPRNSTYPSVEPYILDLLQCHDNRIHYQPNSIHDDADGQQQFAALTMMRAVLHQFTSREYRHGPFAFTLTDLHQSNIFVDDEWHITSLIDLEWACSFPIELHYPPYWLTGRAVDDIEHGEQLQAFDHTINEFMDIFEENEQEQEKKRTQTQDGKRQVQIMRECWKRRSFWYFQAVHSPKGLLRIFNEHIQSMYCEEHCTRRIFDEVVSPYWAVDAEGIIQKKIKDEENYKDQLRERFEEGR